MKNRVIWLLAFIILLLLPSMLEANPSCKVIKGITDVNQRLFNAGVTLGNKLDVKVDGNPDIPSAARFDNPELGHKWDAMLQIRYGLGNCERHWPNGASDETLEAFSDMLLSKRVIDATDVDYEMVGAGFGKTMARYSGNNVPDEWAREYLDDVRDRIGEEPFLSAGYTEAHYFRDMDELFAELPSGDGYPVETNDVKLFIQNQTNASNTGIFVEARAAASRKGEGILRLSVDNTWDELPGVNTGIDILTNQGAYNVGRSYATIRGKLTNTAQNPNKMNHIAQAIVKARSNGKPYKFVIGVPEEGGIPPDLAGKLVELNQEIRSLSSVPADFPEFTTADIIVESFE